MKNKGIFEKVYSFVKKIPPGKVATYGQIGWAINISSRTVGWALHSNKDAKSIPCHRVVNREGRLAPGYVFGGPEEQKYRLLAEGVTFKKGDYVNLEKHLLRDKI